MTLTRPAAFIRDYEIVTEAMDHDYVPVVSPVHVHSDSQDFDVFDSDLFYLLSCLR